MTPARQLATAGSSMPVHSQDGRGAVQQQFFLLGAMNGAALVHPALITGCRSRLDAAQLSIQLARVGDSEGWFADRLNIDRSHWSRMLHGKAAFSVSPRDLARVTGNWALLQWDNRDAGFDMVPHVETPDEELARLRREVGRE